MTERLTDQQVLDRVGPLGPALVGQELYDRAQEIRKRTNDGVLGPAIVGSAPTPPASTPDVAGWEGFQRNTLLKIARVHNLDVKSNYTRDELEDALIAAGIEPPDPESDTG